MPIQAPDVPQRQYQCSSQGHPSTVPTTVLAISPRMSEHEPPWEAPTQVHLSSRHPSMEALAQSTPETQSHIYFSSSCPESALSAWSAPGTPRPHLFSSSHPTRAVLVWSTKECLGRHMLQLQLSSQGGSHAGNPGPPRICPSQFQQSHQSIERVHQKPSLWLLYLQPATQSHRAHEVYRGNIPEQSHSIKPGEVDVSLNS